MAMSLFSDAHDYEIQKSRGTRARSHLIKQKSKEALKRKEKEQTRARRVAAKEKKVRNNLKRANPLSYQDVLPVPEANLEKFEINNRAEEQTTFAVPPVQAKVHAKLAEKKFGKAVKDAVALAEEIEEEEVWEQFLADEWNKLEEVEAAKSEECEGFGWSLI